MVKRAAAVWLGAVREERPTENGSDAPMDTDVKARSDAANTSISEWTPSKLSESAPLFSEEKAEVDETGEVKAPNGKAKRAKKAKTQPRTESPEGWCQQHQQQACNAT